MQIVWIFVLIVILGGCNTSNTSNTRQEAIQTGQNIDMPSIEPSAVPDKIAFNDSPVFDKAVSLAMKAKHRRIEISSLNSFNLDSIPARMDKWFYMVKKYGGKVKTSSITRGFSEKLIELIVGIYKLKENMIYKPAKDYNVTIYYNIETKVIEQVVFKHKIIE